MNSVVMRTSAAANFVFAAASATPITYNKLTGPFAKNLNFTNALSLISRKVKNMTLSW